MCIENRLKEWEDSLFNLLYESMYSDEEDKQSYEDWLYENIDE